ncbi:MAG: hypothetical protein IR153_04005 [Flavobacterium sp.]|nr:hypothetical protein [Flavobacterium sp.]
MSTYEAFYGKFERNIMGFTATGVLVQAIVGGIAAMYVLMNGTSIRQMMQLFVVVACCMIFNGAVLSQQKPRVVYNLLIVSLVANFIITMINLIW